MSGYVSQVGRDYAYETDCPAWKCPHISVHDWREGRRCPEHPCTCSGDRGPVCEHGLYFGECTVLGCPNHKSADQ